MPDGDDLASRSELATLRRRVAVLEAAFAQLARRRVLADGDRAWLAGLLPAIADATNGACWTLPDLAALALLPRNAALAAALAPHTRRAGGLRALGKALARCAGHPIVGLELQRIGACREGSVWLAVRVSNPQETRPALTAPVASS